MTEPAFASGLVFEEYSGNVNCETNLIVLQNEAMSCIAMNDDSVDQGGKEDNTQATVNVLNQDCTENP